MSTALLQELDLYTKAEIIKSSLIIINDLKVFISLSSAEKQARQSET